MKRRTTFLADPPENADVRAIYEDDLVVDGYVNNQTRAWCWRPDVLLAFHALRAQVLADSTLSPREVAVMVVATAATRGDAYCSLAWGAKLASLADDETAAAVVSGKDTGLSKREAALTTWARQIVLDPNATTDQDVERLREAGLTDREVFEASTHIALRLAFSTVNDALGADPDRQLVSLVPAAVRAAVDYGRVS